MSKVIQTTVLLAGLMLAATSFAQAPAGAPAGATGQCKDGSYWSNATKKGACSGHAGVQTWYGSPDAGTASGPPPPAAAAAAATAPASPAATTKSQAAEEKVGGYTPPTNAAPGGGPGTVWVNKNSKVYHCPSDVWYGKTKNGAYMSEADAKAQGNRPDHGKACS
jgi:hypothetical protein